MTDPLIHRDFETLRRISAHLETLASDMVILEDAIASFSAHVAFDAAENHIESLQRADFISQSIQDLGRLTLALSIHSDARGAELAKVKLDSTRALFDFRKENSQKQSGDVDLF